MQGKNFPFTENTLNSHGKHFYYTIEQYKYPKLKKALGEGSTTNAPHKFGK